ncbi:MAG: flagellar biosynthesis protein FlhA [Syntrophorhabdales bacterium]
MERLASQIRDKGDVIIAVSVVFVILIMLIPLNAFLADIFLTVNISVSLLILFIGMYIRRPLDFSVFPSVLLITTLFRLSLNIASTRLILLHGDEGAQAAGRVIKAFGSFIVGGNYVVGCVVFLILIVINFVVITKGAGRVAEVAARFTLDAMPGKQMSIDADLNAGLIDDATARKRRENIEIEADFYGAMDGSSKFVRGDAIAGIIIIFVNILGGFAIGVLQKGMAMTEALSVYTILTIGEGLVSQIPALLTSTAAGIIVTRAASNSNLGRDVVTQVFTQPKAILLASVIIFSIGMVPGMPLMPFMALSSITFAASYVINKAKKEEIVPLGTPPSEEKEKEEVVQPIEILELEIGYALIPIVDADQGGELLDKIRAIRKQMAMELGIVVPPMKLKDNLQQKPGELMTRRETQKLIDSISPTHQKVIEEINQNQVSMGTIQKVLQNLLREQVSVRDLVTILEAIADSCGTIKDPDMITEYVRQRMARSILKPYLVDGVLSILIMEKSLEEKVMAGLQSSDGGGLLALDLVLGQRLVEKIGEEARKVMLKSLQPVLLVHPIIRGKLRKFLERHIQGITVISHNEIPPQIKIQSLGVIKLNEQ